MSWTTPKTDWGVDAVNSSDLNRIEGNTVTLHKGNGQSSLATIVAANNLDINETDETFIIEGSTAVAYIKTTGRQAGNRIQIIRKTGGDVTFYTGQTSPPSNYATIRIYSGNYTLHAYEAVSFVYDGTEWVCLKNPS